jgi:hypothetical protein
MDDQQSTAFDLKLKLQIFSFRNLLHVLDFSQYRNPSCSVLFILLATSDQISYLRRMHEEGVGEREN